MGFLPLSNHTGLAGLLDLRQVRPILTMGNFWICSIPYRSSDILLFDDNGESPWFLKEGNAVIAVRKAVRDLVPKVIFVLLVD